jgi:hypothetical protein
VKLLPLLLVSAWAFAAQALTLGEARAILKNAPRLGGHVGSIALNGYLDHREIDIGRGVRVIAVIVQGGGGLLAFDASGRELGERPTKEITWWQVFDFEGHGQSAVITEEIVAYGTGLLGKEFRIYRVSPPNIALLWSGESFFRNINVTPRQYRRSFLRFDYQTVGTLTWLHETDRGTRTTTVLRFKGGRFVSPR